MKKRKTTGEAKLFLEIWEERLHVCVDCGRSLGNEPRSFYFSHEKGKGAHPELRLDKDNIKLRCFECHRNHDQGANYSFTIR